MEYTVDNPSLKALLESKKENKQLVSKVQSIQLVNYYEVYNIVEKCTKDVEHLRDLFVKHVKPEEIKDKKPSSFTITSSDQATYTIATTKKSILLSEIDLLHRVFPNLKSISLYMFNLRYDEEKDIADANVDNTVSSIDMTFNTLPTKMSKLIMYIFNSYGKHLTTLKIKKGGNISSKDKKWENLSQKVVSDGELLLEHNYLLPKLETVEICQFYQMFPAAAFAKTLSKSNCLLQHASFIGVAQSDSILPHLKKMAKESLKTLALDTRDFPKLHDLTTFPLESLSLRWADNTVIDINAVLNALPHLKSLELGYDMDYKQLQESKTKLTQKTSLQSVALHHVIIDQATLDKIAVDLPTVSKLTLSSCKFGSSRLSVEEKITLLNYSLKELILDNCALYFNKKDGIEKRLINKLNINIDSDCNYTAEIVSKARASMAKFEHVSNVDNQFSYTCFSETAARPTNTLTIILKSIGSIKLDAMGLKAVEFQSDGISRLEPALADVDNIEYDDTIESLVEETIIQAEEIDEEQVIEEIDQEQAIEEIGQEQVIEEIDQEQAIEEIGQEQVIEEIDQEQVIEEIDEVAAVAFTENEGSTAAEDSTGEEGESDGEDTLLTKSQLKQIQKLQEMDQDFTKAAETDSTSTDDSEMEEGEDLTQRRSMRVRHISTIITTRELRKRKRVRYDFSDESSQESESEDDDKPVRNTREKKRMRKSVKAFKSAEPVIKVYPSKRLEGYYK